MNKTNRIIIISSFMMALVINLPRVLMMLGRVTVMDELGYSWGDFFFRFSGLFLFGVLSFKFNLKWLRKAYPDKLNKPIWWLKVIGLNLLILFVYGTIFNRINFRINPIDFERIARLLKFYNYAVFFIVMVASFLINYIFILYREQHQYLLEQERLRSENAQFRLQAMKVQLNPHFLFNALNTLITLIRNNQDRAISYVEKLSTVLRYLLNSADHNVVMLSEELNSLRAYLEIQHVKYDEKLKVDIQLNDMALKSKIPPMTFQILVENAIKHNEITQEHPLLVSIHAMGDKILVTNDFKPRKIKQPSTGKGLVLLTERYQMLFRKTPTISVRNDKFEVELPLTIE